MTPPQIKEQIQAILDGLARLNPGWMGAMVSAMAARKRRYEDMGSPAEQANADLRDATWLADNLPTVKTICTLALRGLEATANEPGEAVAKDIDTRLAQLDEIADGAWGDNPMVRGKARDEAKRLRLTHPAPQDGVPAPVVDDAMANLVRRFVEDFDQRMVIGKKTDLAETELVTIARAALEGQS